jgi:hypothetical protein
MLLVALLSAVGLAATRAENAAGPIDWQVYGQRVGTELSTADFLRFVNQSSRKAVGYGERQYGINLVWVSRFKRTAYFKDFSGTRTLRYRWPLALEIVGGGFLTYRERNTESISSGHRARPTNGNSTAPRKRSAPSCDPATALPFTTATPENTSCTERGSTESISSGWRVSGFAVPAPRSH